MSLAGALQRAGEFQPRRLEWFEEHGIVFHNAPLRDAPGSEAERWEQIAFLLYTDLCEIEVIARTALEGDG